ncbi:ImmA/IrrE family metallo-endopeptidase [Microbacterium sp. gxy059]|uniref:ImmA/IrrE family metallo-endopeptidase n=1 Tax=Microbacterium sp. gxy059 TaxID=2957199 RepID=UPI003D97B9F8
MLDEWTCGLTLPPDEDLMYGVTGYEDHAYAADYDPWAHAGLLDIPVVHRDLPTSEMVAAYSHEHRAIFIRNHLRTATERCALAHEIVHAEHRDIGMTRDQEERADRIAARRLIRPRHLAAAHETTSDPATVALELGVTSRIMEAWHRAMMHGYYGRRWA